MFRDDRFNVWTGLADAGFVRECQSHNIASPTSTTWPVANTAIYIPFSVNWPTIVDKIGVYNGAAANTGNWDVGIYDAQSLARLVSSGTTAQTGGTSILQVISITETTLGPGCYFLGIAADSLSLTFFRHALGSALLGVTFGIREQTSAFNLPDPMVPVVPVNTHLPLAILMRKGLPA